MKHWLTRTVLILSAVSCLNDMSSELLYPVLPLYMASIGYGAVWIGILEGVAEAVGGLTKGWFGEWSDRIGRRKPFAVAGYIMSSLSKPLIALFAWAPWVMLMRTSDRLGKGVRTGARDALLADESHEKARGRVFGFHRMADTIGAVVGPLAALLWLNSHRGESYRPVFFYALVPGVLSILLLLLIRENRKEGKGGKVRSPFAAFGYWRNARPEYRKLLTGILIFTLFNSSDMFLLLLVKQLVTHDVNVAGFSLSNDMFVVVLYVLYNLVYAVLSYPFGWLSDKFGPKRMLLLGYFFFALAYGGMALLAAGVLSGITAIVGCFVLYGFFPALTDGVSKAWISTSCDKSDKGVALGLFAALSSLAALVASVSAGIAWKLSGPVLVFLLPVAFAVITVIYLTFVVPSPIIEKE